MDIKSIIYKHIDKRCRSHIVSYNDAFLEIIAELYHRFANNSPADQWIADSINQRDKYRWGVIFEITDDEFIFLFNNIEQVAGFYYEGREDVVDYQCAKYLADKYLSNELNSIILRGDPMPWAPIVSYRKQRNFIFNDQITPDTVTLYQLCRLMGISLCQGDIDAKDPTKVNCLIINSDNADDLSLSDFYEGAKDGSLILILTDAKELANISKSKLHLFLEKTIKEHEISDVFLFNGQSIITEKNYNIGLVVIKKGCSNLSINMIDTSYITLESFSRGTNSFNPEIISFIENRDERVTRVIDYELLNDQILYPYYYFIKTKDMSSWPYLSSICKVPEKIRINRADAPKYLFVPPKKFGKYYTLSPIPTDDLINGVAYDKRHRNPLLSIYSIIEGSVSIVYLSYSSIPFSSGHHYSFGDFDVRAGYLKNINKQHQLAIRRDQGNIFAFIPTGDNSVEYLTGLFFDDDIQIQIRKLLIEKYCDDIYSEDIGRIRIPPRTPADKDIFLTQLIKEKNRDLYSIVGKERSKSIENLQREKNIILENFRDIRMDIGQMISKLCKEQGLNERAIESIKKIDARWKTIGERINDLDIDGTYFGPVIDLEPIAYINDFIANNNTSNKYSISWPDGIIKAINNNVEPSLDDIGDRGNARSLIRIPKKAIDEILKDVISGLYNLSISSKCFDCKIVFSVTCEDGKIVMILEPEGVSIEHDMGSIFEGARHIIEMFGGDLRILRTSLNGIYVKLIFDTKLHLNGLSYEMFKRQLSSLSRIPLHVMVIDDDLEFCRTNEDAICHYNYILHVYNSWDKAEVSLTNNFETFDAVIIGPAFVDANIANKIIGLEKIGKQKGKGIIPWFVLANAGLNNALPVLPESQKGWNDSGYYFSNDFGVVKVFDKISQLDINTISDNYRVRSKYENVFTCVPRIMSNDNQRIQNLETELYCLLRPIVFGYHDDNFVPARKILELVFKSMTDIGILPPYAYDKTKKEEQVNLQGSARLLFGEEANFYSNGKKIVLRFKDAVIPRIIREQIKWIVNLAGASVHNQAEAKPHKQEEYDVSAPYNHNYLSNSVAMQICTILRWYDDFKSTWQTQSHSQLWTEVE